MDTGGCDVADLALCTWVPGKSAADCVHRFVDTTVPRYLQTPVPSHSVLPTGHIIRKRPYGCKVYWGMATRLTAPMTTRKWAALLTYLSGVKP